jgi:hypothetical protein
MKQGETCGIGKLLTRGTTSVLKARRFEIIFAFNLALVDSKLDLFKRHRSVPQNEKLTISKLYRIERLLTKGIWISRNELASRPISSIRSEIFGAGLLKLRWTKTDDVGRD